MSLGYTEKKLLHFSIQSAWQHSCAQSELHVDMDREEELVCHRAGHTGNELVLGLNDHTQGPDRRQELIIKAKWKLIWNGMVNKYQHDGLVSVYFCLWKVCICNPKKYNHIIYKVVIKHRTHPGSAAVSANCFVYPSDTFLVCVRAHVFQIAVMYYRNSIRFCIYIIFLITPDTAFFSSSCFLQTFLVKSQRT